MTFDDDVQIHHYFNTYKTKADIIQAIRHLPYRGGRTNIAGALELAHSKIFTEEYGDRINYPNYAILFTDGNSNIRADETIPQAIRARIAGIHILSVAVGLQLDMMELRGIVSDPVEFNVLRVDSFRDLSTLSEKAVMGVCNGE